MATAVLDPGDGPSAVLVALLLAGPAAAAAALGPRHADAIPNLERGDPRADGVHLTDRLVTEHPGKAREGEVAVPGVNVGPADAGGAHPDADLAGTGFTGGEVVKLERLADSREDGGAHGLIIGGQAVGRSGGRTASPLESAGMRRPPHLQPPPSASRRGLLLATLLGLGAIGVVLALQGSALFELDRHALPKELALHITALLCLGVLVFRWVQVRLGAVDLAIALWVAWSGVSAVLATNPWLALRAWGISFAGAAVYFAARAAAREGAGPVVTRLLAIAGIVAAVTGLAQAYGLDWDILAQERAPGGTFGNRNFLAHLTVIAVPLVSLAAVEARSRAGRGLWLAGLALMAGALVLTRSRAAWLAGVALTAVAGAAWLLARRRRGIAWRPWPLLTALGAGVVGALLLPNRLSWRSESPYGDSLRGIVNYQEGSGRGRLIQYRNTLRLVAMDPVFGTGPGNWMVHYPRVTTPGDPSFAGADPIPTNPWPSSDWVAYLAERGPIGVVLLLAGGLAAALTALRRLRDPASATSAVALLGLLTAAGTAGLFDAVLLQAAPILFTFAALGALLPETGAVVETSIPNGRQAAVRLALLGLGLLALIPSVLGVTALAVAGPSRERAVLEQAVRWDPGNHRLHLSLALRGSCEVRLPHARAAIRLLPYHEWPRRAMRDCLR